MVSNYFESAFQKQWYCIVKALRLHGKSNDIAQQKHWDYTAIRLILESKKIELILQSNIHYEKRGNLLQVTSFIFMSKPTIN